MADLNTELARLEAERLRPTPPPPTWHDDLTDIIALLFRLCYDADPQLRSEINEQR